MPRTLIALLCASVVLVAFCGPAIAMIDLSLNLRYTNPGIATLGGTWELKARTSLHPNSQYGISALTAVIADIDFGSVVLSPGIGAKPIVTNQSGSIVEFVYEQDPNGILGTTKQTRVGTGSGTPGNVPKDDIFPNIPNPYDNMARIATGTFGAVRPSFAIFPGSGSITSGSNWTDFTASQSSPDTIGFVIRLTSDLESMLDTSDSDGVRGDSILFDGLLPGDVNRSGAVDTQDLLVVLNSFFAGASGWDAGDVSGNDGFVDTNDLLDVLNNFFASAPTPPLTAVPEPTGILLFGAAIVLSTARQRKKPGACMPRA